MIIMYPNLLEQNIYDKDYKGKFLVIGTCIPKLYPKVVRKFEREWKNLVSFCLEQFHYNQLFSKLFNIISANDVKKVGFLTVDGSPHCIQMHYVSKFLKRGLKKDVEFEHYVIRKDGKVFQVSMEAIDNSKDLSNAGKKLF